ncbi:hypothetical protein [Candidatus Mycoplasma haematohominis]|uniref:Uncharacterized protein n=1 Tax=Candidatus Mycoplasma haematohominis TaxID=1494318 RepID=A0A478FS84_9MOLU|nr:hypothetical protein [Candidatus Mycoplasma haemohominis]GCE63319.1 hypothetical protein MHSWG343_03080 [Candidatus Mycoplasma haemohominis]
MNNKRKKVCLNCKGNWEACHGYKCLCVDGACCDTEEDRLNNMKHMAFSYEEVEE